MNKKLAALFIITGCAFGLDSKQKWQIELYNRAIQKQRAITLEYEQELIAKTLLDSNDPTLKELFTKTQAARSKKHQLTKWLSESQFARDEQYAFWDGQGISNIKELVEEFGGRDCIWSIPPKISDIPIHLRTQKPIPSSLWSEIVVEVLLENGVGVKQISPYIKQLYSLDSNSAHVDLFCDSLEVLESCAPNTRVAFLLPFKFAEAEKLHFLATTSMESKIRYRQFNHQILVTGTAEKVLQFLSLARFVLEDNYQQYFEPVVLKEFPAVQAKEFLERMLQGFTTPGSGMRREVGKGVRIFTVYDAKKPFLILSGEKKDVEKVKSLLLEMEHRLKGKSEKVLHWYTCKHCDPEDAVAVLNKVYPQLVKLEGTTGSVDQTQSNFIVESKSSSILMVVEKNILKKIQSVMKKIDQPKKMVRIEVLLFEKKTKNNNRFGLNNLKTGDFAHQHKKWGLDFNKGVLNFLFQNGKSVLPKFDLGYQFLLTNQDIQINACPSVTTVNSTTATISLTEEISVNTGAVLVEGKDGGRSEQKFSREKFGIVLKITPTINFSEDFEDQAGYITLDTDIEFDTINSNKNDRPDVSKRHIQNQVRVGDGQTLIIGGLRRKDKEGTSDKIPFLGEIPGIGKLFSETSMNDNQTEMFIFITPHIVADPVEYLEKMQINELQKRPGDLPEFLQTVEKAKEEAKRKLFEKSIELLFDTSESINE